MTKIDISHDMYSPGLWARKIWEHLFRAEEAWRWPSLDSMLCDLKEFTQVIEEGLHSKGSVTFWWECASQGWTDTTTFDSGSGYKITVTHGDVITIEKQ